MTIQSEWIRFVYINTYFAILLFRLLRFYYCEFPIQQHIQFPKRTIDGQFEYELWWMQFYFDSTVFALWIRNRICVRCYGWKRSAFYCFFTKFDQSISLKWIEKMRSTCRTKNVFLVFLFWISLRNQILLFYSLIEIKRYLETFEFW